jgi:hypothetical protein
VVPSVAKADGDMAAEIFDRLERNVHPVDIVKELRVHPDVVAGFVELWARMRDTIIVAPEDITALEAVRGLRRLTSGADLAVRVAAVMKRAPSGCKHCGLSAAVYCQPCVAQSISDQLDQQEAELRRRHRAESRQPAAASSGDAPTRVKSANAAPPVADDSRVPNARAVSPVADESSSPGDAAP